MERFQSLDATLQEGSTEQKTKNISGESDYVQPGHFSDEIFQVLRESRTVEFDEKPSEVSQEYDRSVIREDDPFRLIEEKEAELREARAQLEYALASEKRYHDEWKQATYDLNVLQTDRIYKTDDDFFIGAWNELRYEIKNWATQHFDDRMKVSSWERPRSPSKQLTDRVSNFDACMSSKRHRPSLIQAFVWYKLERDVFASDRELGLLWAGSEFYRYKNLRRILEPASFVPDDQNSPAKLKEYHKWRALTSRLVEQRTHPLQVDRRQRMVAESIAEVLAPFSSSSDEVFRNGFISGIWRIVAKATRLDAEFHKQLAVFTVWIPRSSKDRLAFGYKPNPGTFQDENEAPLDPRRPVALVIVPALRKRGNADGECYENDIVLVKSCAIQDEPKKSRENEPLATSNSSDTPGGRTRPSIDPKDGQSLHHNYEIPHLQQREQVRRSTWRRLRDALPTLQSQQTSLEQKARAYASVESHKEDKRECVSTT